MSNPLMYGMDPSASYELSDPEGVRNAVEWMRRHIDACADNARWITPSNSIVVLDKTNKRMIRVHGSRAESSIETVCIAIGWKFVDKANGEEVA